MCRPSLPRHNNVAVLCCMERIQLCSEILYYIYIPPKKRPVPKHVTRMHTGKLPRRAASVITSAESITAALLSAARSEAIAALVMRHLEQSGCLLSASIETVLPPRAYTLPTRRLARASRLPVSTSHRSVPMPSTSTTVPPTQPLLSDDSDSDVDALLSGLLYDRTSQTYSSLARSNSSINTSSIEVRNAASLEH